MSCLAAHLALEHGAPRTSIGSFELHGEAQLRDWVVRCINSLPTTERDPLLRYVSHMQFSLGTLCSGTDSPALVMKVALQAMLREGGDERHEASAAAKFTHAFSCEKNPWKRKFILRMFCGGGGGGGHELQRLFCDAQEVAAGSPLHDEVSGGLAPCPRPSEVTDMAVGFPCQDVSKLNVNRGTNLTVVRDGSKRTGLVYVSLMKFLRSEGPRPLHIDSFHDGMQGLLLEDVLGLLEPPKGWAR